MTRLLSTLLGTLVALAAALAVAAAVFLRGVDLDAEFLREPLERALTAAFAVPTRIEGPLRLRTGRSATLSADALVLADPAGPAGATLARGIAPSARIDLPALLRRSVLLEEVGGQRLELSLRRRAGAGANWQQLFSSPGGSSTLSFAGIERLRIDAVAGDYQGEGGPPVPFAIAGFDGAMVRDRPVRGAGTARFAGTQVGFDLRVASLAGLSSAAGVPLQGTVAWSGVQARIDGTLFDRGTRLAAQVDASAADAGAPLAALGITATEPGAMALRGRLAVTASGAEASDLAVSVGRSDLAGAASVVWDGPRPRFAFDLRGDLLDAGPFVDGAPLQAGRQALEQWVARLQRLATAGGFSAKLSAGEVDGLPVTIAGLLVDVHGGDDALAGTLAARLAGTPVQATLDYDARRPRHTLSARIDSRAASTTSLPGRARPAAVALRAGSIRGRLEGGGADAAAIVASLRGDLDVRNIAWTLHARRPAISGRFERLRLELGGARTSAEVAVTVQEAACRLTVSGGAAAPLLAGRPWPMQLSASCPDERLGAKGRIALAGRRATADLDFDLAADGRGPLARAAGLPPAVSYPVAARGALQLDAQRAQVRLDHVRAGRSNGSGEVSYPLGGAGTPRLRLALETLSLDEPAAKRTDEDRATRPDGPGLPRAPQRLPDADFELTAKRIEYGGARLFDFRFEGALRARALRAAPFAVRWEGIAVRGRVDVDLDGGRPRFGIDAAAHDADLRPLLDRIGADQVEVRAAKLSMSFSAAGERLQELLASATVDAVLEGARIALPRPLLIGAKGRGAVDATFSAAPGRPTTLAARGELDERPLELSAEGPPLDALAADGAGWPLGLRGRLGDLRIEADGTFGRAGADARVRVEGERLDQLGRRLGLALPEAAPYAASAKLRLAPGGADVSDLQASFGSSRVAGRLHTDWRPGRRPLHTATLHSPQLHLEDIGAGGWVRERGPGVPVDTHAQPVGEVVEHLMALLPRADVEASIEVDALLGGGQKFASGEILVNLTDGALHVRLRDVQSQDGTGNAELRVDAAASPPRFGLRADVRGVEYGALSRAMRPGSQLNGTADLVADLSAQAPPAGLMQALQGTIDLAAFPRDMKSDALGLWGAGLLPLILRTVERDAQAQVHCSVLAFALADGVARSDGFFVETTSVRIVGDLEIRLDTWEMAGRIDPRSNRPRFFAISPRMQIGGSLGNPSLSVAPESVVLVPLRFASPLALYSSDWLGRGGRRAPATAGCREAFARVLELHHAQASAR